MRFYRKHATIGDCIRSFSPNEPAPLYSCGIHPPSFALLLSIELPNRGFNRWIISVLFRYFGRWRTLFIFLLFVALPSILCMSVRIAPRTNHITIPTIRIDEGESQIFEYIIENHVCADYGMYDIVSINDDVCVLFLLLWYLIVIQVCKKKRKNKYYVGWCGKNGKEIFPKYQQQFYILNLRRRQRRLKEQKICWKPLHWRKG